MAIGYSFTDKVRKVLMQARAEAWRLGHEYVGTEHLLLGLVRENDGVALAALSGLHVDRGQLVAAVEARVPPGSHTATAGQDLPYTSRAKKVLELAMIEAQELNHNHIGTEHLLLGLVRQSKGIAAEALSDAGVTLDNARAEVLRLLGEDAAIPPSQWPGAAGAPLLPRLFIVLVVLTIGAHLVLGRPSNWSRPGALVVYLLAVAGIMTGTALLTLRRRPAALILAAIVYEVLLLMWRGVTR